MMCVMEETADGKKGRARKRLQSVDGTKSTEDTTSKEHAQKTGKYRPRGDLPIDRTTDDDDGCTY